MSTPPPHQHASKLAQLLGEVLIHHAPHTARINSTESRRQIDDWLEGLEAHTSRLITPYLQRVLDESDPPEVVKGLIGEAINPTAQFSTTLTQIFLWGIVSSIISTSAQPFLQGISNDLSAVAVGQGIHRPTDLATIATAAGRGLNLGDPPTVSVPQWAYDQAAQLGVAPADVDLAASLIGLPPALQELFELYRRGLIDINQVKQGLREGDFRDDWIDTVIGLAHAWLTPGDFVRAAVQSQLPYSVARDWATATGLDTSTDVPIATQGTEATPDMFGLAFSIAGRPPGPEELARMALRGIIPWQGTGADQTTFEQGIAESDVKTKWTPALQALSAYVPPPRTVGTLLEHGAITAAQAQTYWEQGGVPPALAAGYVYMTQQQHVGQDKLLAKGDITTAYFDGLITQQQALDYLDLLGYRGQVAQEVIAIADFRREIQAVNRVISHVGSYYTSFKISPTDALKALVDVGVDQQQAQRLLSTWDELRIAPLRVPTTSEIGKAVKYGTLTPAEGQARIQQLGYQAQDAAIVLSSEAEIQVTPLPPPGTGVIG